MVELDIGIGSIETSLIGYHKLLDIYEQGQSIKGKSSINLNFEKLTWIDANMSAVLYAVLDRLKDDRKFTYYVDIEYIQENFDILVRNGFFTNLVKKTKNGTEINLTLFDQNNESDFINYIANDLLNNGVLDISSQDRGQLIDHFLEIFCNVQKHANTSKPIIACGQYYPNKHKLVFTLVDMGIGYLPAIRSHTEDAINTSGDAILWALKGNTTKTDAPGGLGLKEILKFCKRSMTDFHIITGDHYWNRNNSKITTKVRNFDGTIVHIIFHTK